MTFQESFNFRKVPAYFWVIIVALVPCTLYVRHPEALFDPLYWDSIMAVYNEVFWLLDHGFSLSRLASESTGFSAGGANTYFFSWYPITHAFIISILPEGTNVLFVLHLLTWILAGLITSVFVRFLASFCSLCTAVFGAILLCLTPLFLSQCYLINMELWLLLFCFLGVQQLLSGRPMVSGAWLLLAFYTKASALAIVLPCVAFYTLLYIRDLRSFLKGCWLGLPLVLFVVHGYIASHWINQFGGETYVVVGNLFSLQSILAMVRRGLALSFEQYIYLWIMAGLTIVYAGMLTMNCLRKKRSFKMWREQLALESVGLLCGMICASILLMTTLQSLYLPRYIVVTLPYPIIWFLWATRKKAQLRILIGMGWCALNIANVNGAICRKVSTAHLPNNGDTLERSLEYRADLELRQKLCKLLESEYADYHIVSSWPILHQLVEPRFGYVSEPFRVSSSERKVLAWKGVKLWSEEGNPSMDLSKVLWVSSDSAFFRHTAYDSGKDVLVEKVEHKGRTLWIYKKRM